MQFIDQKFTSVIKRWHLGWLTGSAFLLFSAGSLPAAANVTIIQEDFNGSTAYGWTVGGVGSLCLTAEGSSPPESIPNCTTTSDLPGEGALRLTNLRISDQRAFAFYDYAIPANQGLVITFDYFAYGGRTVEQSGADGTTFFLFDGNTPMPDPGAQGGALGYAQLVTPNATETGLANAYIGVGLDEFGNFANDYEGRGNGCPNQSPFGGGPELSPPAAQVKDSVTIRGSGDGLTGYCFIVNSGDLSNDPGGFGIDNPFAASRTAPGTIRRVRITLNTNNTITVEIDPTGTGTAYQTILSNVPTPPDRPDTFKFGFASSTGAGANFHELINLGVETIETPPQPDLTITKSHTGNFFVGGTGTYTLDVQNLPTATGPTYGPVTIKDTLPSGFNFVSATGTDWNCSAVGQEVTCVYTGSAISPGESLPTVTLNVNVTVPQGTYINPAEVSTEADSNLTNNTTQDSTIVVDPVVASKTFTDLNGSDVEPGDIIEYTVAIANNSSTPVTGVTFQDAIPANTTYVTDSTRLNGTSIPDINGTMPFVSAIAVNSPGEPVGQINPNEAATVTFQAQIVNPLPPGIIQVVNQGLVQGNDIPGTNTDDPRTPEVNDPTVTPLTPLAPPATEPNLRLIKRITSVTRDGVLLSGIDFSRFVDDPDDSDDDAPGWTQLPLIGAYQLGSETPLQSGDEVEYTIYFLSDGSSPANNIQLCDLIPAGTTFVPNSIQTTIGTVPIGGNFLSPLTPLPTGNACSDQTNPNGVVTVNLGNISNATGGNFGFIRFRVRID